MSQRLGMADGRCFTIHSSAQLTNSYLMKENKINAVDNYSYRKLLQKNGPEILSSLQKRDKCDSCDQLPNMSNIY